jgi:hypothetical protein
MLSNDKLKMEGREQKSHQAGQSFTSSFDLLGAWSLLYRTSRSSCWKQIHKWCGQSRLTSHKWRGDLAEPYVTSIYLR